MITLRLKNETEIIAEQQREDEVYLAFKTRTYQPGDVIEIETESEGFLWVQVDEALEPSLIYLKTGIWHFPVILDEELRRAYSPKIFAGERHYIHAWVPDKRDVSGYRNLARNAHDQKLTSRAYPHAYANVETRNDSTFFARNAIDGMIANESHGSFPYQSWGINQQADAQITVDFGRAVEVEELALVLRGDYPHDSYWTSVTLVFSDGAELTIDPVQQLARQFFSLGKKVTTSVTLKNLVKHVDESPFPALTELEVYGSEV